MVSGSNCVDGGEVQRHGSMWRNYMERLKLRIGAPSWRHGQPSPPRAVVPAPRDGRRSLPRLHGKGFFVRGLRASATSLEVGRVDSSAGGRRLGSRKRTGQRGASLGMTVVCVGHGMAFSASVRMIPVGAGSNSPPLPHSLRTVGLEGAGRVGEGAGG